MEPRKGRAFRGHPGKGGPAPFWLVGIWLLSACGRSTLETWSTEQSGGAGSGGSGAGGGSPVTKDCGYGSFDDGNGRGCVPWSVCQPGTRVSVSGTVTSDRRCEDCSVGTFSSEENAPSCTPWRQCPVGSTEDAPGTTTSDRSCVGEGWIRQFGTESTDVAYSVTAAGGGLYVAGYTNAALPGQTHEGDAYDAFARRYDYAGVEQWTRQFSLGDPECVAYAVSAVEGGALYVAGYTGRTVPTLLTQAFVRKYDGAGTEQWTDVFGSDESASALAVVTDESGGVVVAGQVGAALPGQLNAGCDDAFVRKYDAAGAELWTHQFGSIGCDAANAVTLDGAGNVYVVGHTAAGLPDVASLGKNDAFVRKYDAAGGELWTRQFGSDDNDYGNAVAVDDSGNVYVAGNTLGTLPNQARLSDSDLFLRKYDGGGTELWTVQTGTTRSDAANALARDTQGNVYVTGNTSGTFPGQERAGGYDAFALAFDSAGTRLWSVQLGSNEADGVNGASVDESGSLYVAGFTRGVLPEQVSAGVSDAFVARLAMPIW